MAVHRFWWPGRLAEQLVVIATIMAKIAQYASALALSQADVDKIISLCEAVHGAMTFTENCKTTMQATTAWRDQVLTGQPRGVIAEPPPQFPNGGSPDYEIGSLTQLFKWRETIMARPGYTRAIGEDLMLVGAEYTPTPDLDLSPSLKVKPVGGYEVRVSGSMQGATFMKVEYRPKFGPWREVGQVTNLPANVHIDPADPAQPESGRIRGIFVKKNQVIGTYSPDYPVVIS
jgi:hypothetical protein